MVLLCGRDRIGGEKEEGGERVNIRGVRANTRITLEEEEGERRKDDRFLNSCGRDDHLGK